MEIAQFLEQCIKLKASDFHLIPGLPPMMRIDGELIMTKDVPVVTPEETKRLLYNAMTPDQQQLFERQLVCDLAVSYPNIGHFRVSVFHQLNGIAAVFRIIPNKVPTFDEMGLPTFLKKLLVLSHGLILVTGPTGCGKSTTMAVMIDYINMLRPCNIITIEDPIEYIFQAKRSAVNQLQVGRDTPCFSTALRASLRQDPDVIMIGEMRDLESIRLALTAAETGHLVLTTLHASSAPIAVSRIIDVFPTEEKNRVRNMLSETIQAIVCQTLIRKMTGGRVAAFEFMLGTPAIRHSIRQDSITHIESTMQTSGDVGMCTLDQYLQELISKRIISTTVARNTLLNRGGSSFTNVENKK